MKSLYWFRNDLRLKDNEALWQCCQQSSSWLPVFCIDELWMQTLPLGFKKMEQYRAKFLIESLEDIQQQLQQQQSDLLVLKGNTASLIKNLITQHEIEALFFHKAITQEETDIENEIIHFCEAHQVKVYSFWGNTLYHVDDLQMSIEKLPDVFTQFRQKQEKYATVRACFSVPETFPVLIKFEKKTLPTLISLAYQDFEISPKAAIHFKGGETAAWQRVNYYIHQTEYLYYYKLSRNELLGSDYSSKLSAWLSLGCISAKSIYVEVKKREAKTGGNESTYWLIFELIWRDYFQFVALKFGNKLFHKNGLKKKPIQKLKQRKELFNQWCMGKTGIPFIDANMIELLETGFMSNRGRQNVASFLVKDLQIDWRWGAAWFETWLIDYDVCSNYGNWNYVAGIGNDPREDRYFNILVQTEKYDTEGDYVKHWLPQLNALPPYYIHQPYLLSKTEKEQFGITNYAEPILNVNTWKSKKELRR